MNIENLRMYLFALMSKKKKENKWFSPPLSCPPAELHVDVPPIPLAHTLSTVTYPTM